MRTDSLDVSSLVSYINDIKPFHSKLTDVIIEYQANDNLFVKIKDTSFIEMQFSSVWDLQMVSDGKRTQYRIPAAVFPHYSTEFHQSDRKGVVDEVPGRPGAYAVPCNNGVTVYLNNGLLQKDIHYTIDKARSAVQFINQLPQLGDVVTLKWSVVDHVFVAINGVWQSYDLEYASVGDGMEMIPYDLGTFDSSNSGNIEVDDPQKDIVYKSVGHVHIVVDSTGKDYYVFEFYQPLPLNTTVEIRVEQREAYNGWTQTTFTESVTFQDLHQFYDTVNAWIVDPGTWNIDHVNPNFDSSGYDLGMFDFNQAIALFGIDISSLRQGNFDSETFDVMGFDSINSPPQIGYWNLFTINENLADSVRARIGETYLDQVGLIRSESISSKVDDGVFTSVTLNEKDSVASTIVDYDLGNWDVSAFDTVAYDTQSSTIISVSKNGPTEATSTYIMENLSFTFDDGSGVFAIYSPDPNGIVNVTTAATQITINHNFGYVPQVSIYYQNQQIYPKSLTYPSASQVLIQFSNPMAVVIRLA